LKDLKLIGSLDSNNPPAPRLNDIAVVDYDIATTEFVARKTQDILKILVTTFESVPAYPLYGSGLPDIIGTRRPDDLHERISDAVIEALSFLSAVESSTLPSERIARIVSLQVTDGDDARTVIIRLVVEMEDGSIATTQFLFATNN